MVALQMVLWELIPHYLPQNYLSAEQTHERELTGNISLFKILLGVSLWSLSTQQQPLLSTRCIWTEFTAQVSWGRGVCVIVATILFFSPNSLYAICLPQTVRKGVLHKQQRHLPSYR